MDSSYGFGLPLWPLLQATIEVAALLAIAIVIAGAAAPTSVRATGVVGCVLALVSATVSLAEYAEMRFLDSSHVLAFLSWEHPHALQVLGWLHVTGLVMLAVAIAVLVRDRRSALPH